MAPIPGWVMILAGILVSAFSKFVERRSEPGTFTLFFYIGIIFIVIGVGKYIFRAVKKKKADNAKQALHLSHPLHAQQHPNQYPQQHSIHTYRNQHYNPNRPAHMQGQHSIHKAAHQQVQHQSIVACPACGTRHYNYAKYCMRCGTSIKK